jgi:hypothetical protein
MYTCFWWDVSTWYKAFVRSCHLTFQPNDCTGNTKIKDLSCIGYRACQGLSFGTIKKFACQGDDACLMCHSGDVFNFCGPDVDLSLLLSLPSDILGDFVDLLGSIASGDGLLGGIDIGSVIGGTLSSSSPPPTSSPTSKPSSPTQKPSGGGSGGLLGGLGRLIGGGRRLETLSSVTVGEGSCNGVRIFALTLLLLCVGSLTNIPVLCVSRYSWYCINRTE